MAPPFPPEKQDQIQMITFPKFEFIYLPLQDQELIIV